MRYSCKIRFLNDTAPYGSSRNQLCSVPTNGEEGDGTQRAQRGTGIMNETRNKKGPEHFIIITSFTDTHLRAFVPLSSQLSPRIEYVSFIRSFIHSFIPRQLCQCHLTPTPLSAPLGALNGSWRRCGTLCCFQEALLNAFCPVALSLSPPHLPPFSAFPSIY